MNLCLYPPLVHSFSHWFLILTSLTLLCFHHHKYRPFSTIYVLSQSSFFLPPSLPSFFPLSLFLSLSLSFSIFPFFLSLFLFWQKDSLEPAQAGFYMGTGCNLTETHKQTKIHPDLLWSATGNLKAIKNSDFYLLWARMSLSHYISVPL